MSGVNSAFTHGPHAALPLSTASERLAARLLDQLWQHYRQRVSYVRDYEAVVRTAGGTFINDHIALRTFACQDPFVGIGTLSRIFAALDYVPSGCYQFADKHLSAVHLQHPGGLLPKIFISELQTWRLPEAARKIIQRVVRTHRMPISDETLARVANAVTLSDEQTNQLVDRLVAEFHDLPWNLPERSDVESLNKFSQYGAWVLVHGYNVNHFTSLINSHGVESLANIERTIDALRQAGTPMKAEIEGAVGSKLRQTATEAVVIDVAVNDGGQQGTMPWSYAYFELAERGDVVDPDTGRRGRFEGFLGAQATQLFEMTRRG